MSKHTQKIFDQKFCLFGTLLHILKFLCIIWSKRQLNVDSMLVCVVLSMQGDLIDALDDQKDGWQFGSNFRTGKSGWFPVQYVDQIWPSPRTQ